MSSTGLPDQGPEGTIPVAAAIQLTSNWRNYLTVNTQQAFVTHAWYIPIIDFQNILQYNPTAEGVRAYIGLADANDPNSSQLVLVPVVSGKDVCYLNPPKGGLRGDDDGDSNTYDFTNPCPPQCDDDSPLNG